jgi:hypothetical protein
MKHVAALLLAVHGAAAAKELTVYSINFACRDVLHLAGCDNCQTRFDLIASAFLDDSGFEGVPNLDEVDVVVAQELSTSEAAFAQVTAALASRGFTHTTGAPAPTVSDPHCVDPPGPLYDIDDKKAFSALSGLKSGGLVTFSKHPIKATARQNWCVHNLPAPAGYLSTLLDVDGTAALVVNVHLFPEYDFGIDAHEIRTYQFSELSAFANAADLALRFTGPYAIILAGDFNEDAYGLSSASTGPRCDLISEDAATKLGALSLDVRAACASGAVGQPTWSPSTNDLAEKFSEGSKHEVLDYIVLHSSSPFSPPPAAANVVATLKIDATWSGSFCESSILGTLGATYDATAKALTDHNTVTAAVEVPDGADKIAEAAAAFDDMLLSWRSSQGAQEAACGQRGSICGVDTNCCEAPFSWTGVEQHCDSFQCEACVPLGGTCGAQWEGSGCCNYDQYPNGAHCEMRWNGPACIPKYDNGHSCWWDQECNSKNCEMTWMRGWWSWIPAGKKCK